MKVLTGIYKAVGLSMLALAVSPVNSVFATEGFRVEVNVTDALLTDRHSQVWKQDPSAVNENYKYLVVGRRSDGAVMVLYQQPGIKDETKLFLSGTLFKCGVKKDWPIYQIDNAADVKKQLEQPLLDDPRREAWPISEGTNVAVVYDAVCRK